VKKIPRAGQYLGLNGYDKQNRYWPSGLLSGHSVYMPINFRFACLSVVFE